MGASMMMRGGPGGVVGAGRKTTLFVMGDSLSSFWIYGRKTSSFEARTDIVSVGSVTPLPVGQPHQPNFDRFEGHGGTATSVFLANINTWYGRAPAAVVMIHVGTAEYFSGQTDASIYAANMKSIVDAILVINPAAKFCIAKILNARSEATVYQGYVVAFRAALVAILAGYSQVTFINMPVIADAEYEDTIHPLPVMGGSGYTAMAQAFYNGLVSMGVI